MQQSHNPYAAPETRRRLSPTRPPQSRYPVRSAPLDDDDVMLPPMRARFSFSLNKPIAVFLWAVACITTYQLAGALRPDLGLRVLIGVAIGVQIVFTWLEKPVLRGKPNKISSAVLLLDTITNAGGIFPMAMRAPETPAAQMLIAAFNLSPSISPLGAALLSLVFGFLLAAAPEAVWRWKE